MRWVVGDVQGCARELGELLEHVRFDPARDELVSVGDLVNRGPDSAGALRLWRDAGGLGVVGNHEVYALQVRSGRTPRERDRLDALFAAPDCEALLARVRALPLLLHLPRRGDGPEAWVVHGGLHPRWRDLAAIARRLNAEPHDEAWLASPEVQFATSVRACTADGEMSAFTGPPDACPPGYRPWDAFYRGPALVVHGHWARRGYYRSRHALGLDSGCVYGRSLSAWCQDEDRVVQIPSRTAVAFGGGRRSVPRLAST